MIKIVVVGVTGTRNRGVEALLVTLVDGIRSRVPDCAITVLTDDVDFDKRHCCDLGIEFIHTTSFRLTDRLPRPVARTVTILQGMRGPRQKQALAALRACDLVLISGGDMLTSDYGSRSLRNALSWAHVGYALGKSVVALGQSVGPFRSERDRKLWLLAQRKIKLITFRERYSSGLLQQDGLLDPAKVSYVADSAFLLATLQGAARRQLIDFYDLEEGRYIALSVSAGIAKYRHGNVQSHRAVLLKLIERSLENGRNVLIVPHVNERSLNNDDSFLAASLLRDAGFDKRVRVAGNGHTAAEYKTLISGAAFAVAERMHAAIAALSTGVPVLVVGYSVKARGILTEALGQPDLVDSSLIDFDSFVRMDRAIAQLEKFEGNTVKIAEALNQAGPRLRTEAAANFERLVELLKK